jgi:hypothetical protein
METEILETTTGDSHRWIPSVGKLLLGFSPNVTCIGEYRYLSWSYKLKS